MSIFAVSLKKGFWMRKWESVTLWLSLFVEPKGHCEQAQGGFFPWCQTKWCIKLGEVCLQVKMKRMLAALGENISSGMFSAAVFHYTWNSSGDKDLMYITSWTCPTAPCHFLLQREKGRRCKRRCFSFPFNFFFPFFIPPLEGRKIQAQRRYHLFYQNFWRHQIQVPR